LPSLLQRQSLDDFIARAGVSGRRECNAWHLREALMQDRQLTVFRTKIMAPLRHAVRLVDCEQRDFSTFQQAQEAPCQQPFRRDVEQIQFARQQLPLDLALILGAQAGIEVGGGDASLAQCVDLILHQRDQRRHHDAGTLSLQRGDLIAQRLAAAGRHQHQRITAFAYTLDDRLLLAAETGITENALK